MYRPRSAVGTRKSVVFLGAAAILWVPLWFARELSSELSTETRMGLSFSMIVLLLAFGHSVRELNLLILVDTLERRAVGSRRGG